ncbi:tryptophan synthase subunit alpha [Wenzhouxiangella sp. XN79A]|uniref:tryptophan synthase subunit alpha n=1 Tax=Wenzhouxiangella sp. XN79A TaxID=2724193 RepID=UPI00144A7C37|nr:tryptophan synthase subunit alpha [Wenzhouxiangella sp. XN79A]NKI35915.1 tryptophan synthase subunit alpha [Wenzhouxiangella sp. XN79A]
MTANRIDRRFGELAAAGRPGLIPYVTAGHPAPDATVQIMHRLVAGGADLLELGVPFSDVMADGPVIQNACQRALDAGMTLDRVFDMVRAFREDDGDTPVILMGYMNPIERRGLDTFVEQARAAGVDGLLIVDCPSDEAGDTRAALAGQQMHQIFLVAPTTTDSRIERMVPLAGGFVYYVSLKGVTGSAALDADALAPAIERLRAHTPLPVAVGFGISTPAQAADVARVADAVVIGSALVKALDGCDSAEAAVAVAGEFAEGMRAALDAVGAASTGQVARA